MEHKIKCDVCKTLSSITVIHHFNEKTGETSMNISKCSNCGYQKMVMEFLKEIGLNPVEEKNNFLNNEK